MKIQTILAFIVLILFIPKSKTQGSHLYISEKTNITQAEIIEHKYTDRELNRLYSDKKLGSIAAFGSSEC